LWEPLDDEDELENVGWEVISNVDHDIVVGRCSPRADNNNSSDDSQPEDAVNELLDLSEEED
jgi:hypothetical protein